MIAHHEWDDDCGCIHCGLDGADVPRSSEMPACTVHDEAKRADNRARAQSRFGAWDDWDTLEAEYDMDMPEGA